MNEPTFSEVWANSGSSDPLHRSGNLVEAALQIESDDDIAELIGRTWKVCQFFDLQPDQLAVVAGAYKGKVIDCLLQLYPGIRVVGFEPQRWAVQEAARRLGVESAQVVGGNKNGGSWTIYPFGIGDETRQDVPMGEFETDACSFINIGEQARQVGAGDMVDVAAAFAIFQSIDLLVLNCEGYEYRLLNRLIQSGWISQVRQLCIQWHLGLAGNGDLAADEADVDEWLDRLQGGFDFRLVVDQRPAWTLLSR